VYDQPLRPSTTATGRLLVRITRLIPPGRWAAYGDVGTVGFVCYAQAAAASLSAACHAPTAGNPVANRQLWNTCWHRVRGADGSIRCLAAEDRHAERAAYCNGLLEAEGCAIGADDCADQANRISVAELAALATDAGLL
jgi:alkylated DNA nucleotide flippase Atl1